MTKPELDKGREPPRGCGQLEHGASLGADRSEGPHCPRIRGLAVARASSGKPGGRPDGPARRRCSGRATRLLGVPRLGRTGGRRADPGGGACSGYTTGSARPLYRARARAGRRRAGVRQFRRRKTPRRRVACPHPGAPASQVQSTRDGADDRGANPTLDRDQQPRQDSRWHPGHGLPDELWYPASFPFGGVQPRPLGRSRSRAEPKAGAANDRVKADSGATAAVASA
jgi:hypothetical protein